MSANRTDIYQNPLRRGGIGSEGAGAGAAPNRGGRKQPAGGNAERTRFASGDSVFVAHPTEQYAVCTVKSVDPSADEVTCFDDAYKTYKVSIADVFPTNPPEMQAVDDNTNLMYLHDAALLHNIRERYARQQIYTYTAFILIAVNPYQHLSIYSDEHIKKYAEASFGRLPPHVYAVASRAYRSLKSSSVNQSIVVSGESGAGKTETCKHIMRFMASVCGEGGVDELERKVLGSSPILESFGNAKTLRNNNSSRFGKFTELHFDDKAAIRGASIDTYLLEKNRLILQTKGERSFHVFFELLAAKVDGHMSGPPESYTYLRRSECATVEHKDDVADFKEVEAAMGELGISGGEQTDVWNALLALLELGNVEYEGVDGDSRDKAVLTAAHKSTLATAAKLLGVDSELLLHRTLHRTVKAGAGESIEVGLSAYEASNSRDAFAKFVYGSLFDWIVHRINTALSRSSGETSTRFIGLLDLSGFEIFETNSFEQFCINFANEKIQQYFNSQILQQEQEIYELEGLRFRKVEFEDNQPVIDVAEDRRTGVFALLDEACLMPRATDQTFTATVHSKHLGSKFLGAPANKRGVKKRLLEDEAFVVLHFAGEVTYETARFLDKNNDTIHDELLSVLCGSASSFVQSLVPTQEAEDCSFGPSGGRFKSVSENFNRQLGKLMGVLQKTTSHFIRCIKPNEVQRPMILEPTSVMTQLRYSGMCAALVLMQAGFPTRVSFQELYDRYKPHMPRQMLGLKPITFCEAILVALDLDGGRDFQMGLTKVFFRPGKLAQMNDALVSSDPADVDIVVRKVRLWLARKRFFAAGWSIVALNRIMDNVERHRYFKRFRTFANVVVRLQRCVKPWIARVRKRLYDDGALAKRREEERILAEKRAAEEARRAEEERKRKEQAERKRQEEEAEKQRKIEEEKRKREEAWQSMVDKLAALTESNTQLQSQLDSAVARQTDIQGKLDNETDRRSKGEVDLGSAKQALESAEGKLVAMEQRYSDAVAEAEARLDAERKGHSARLTEFAQAAEGDQAQLMAKMQTAMEEKSAADEAKLVATEAELKTQRDVSDALTSDLASLQTRFDALTASKNAENEAASAALAALQETLGTTKSTLEGSLAKLTTELEEEGHALNDTRAQLSLAQLAVMDLEADGEELRTTVARLETQLAEAMASHDSVSAELQSERHAREDQVHTLESNLAEAKKQAANDGEVKDALSAALKLELQATQEKLESEKARSSAALKALAAGKSDVEEELHETTEALREAERVSTARATEIARLEGVVEQLQHERRVLQDKAADGLLSAAKLRTMFDSYYKGGKMDTELLVRLHGSASFETLAVKATKLSKVEKQGGQNEKKWETRLFVLIDNFLVYYGSEKDKTPKGAVRLDKSHVELCDLSKVNRQHGIRVTDPRNQRTLTFAASSAEEQLVWKAVLEAGGLTL